MSPEVPQASDNAARTEEEKEDAQTWEKERKERQERRQRELEEAKERERQELEQLEREMVTTIRHKSLLKIHFLYLLNKVTLDKHSLCPISCCNRRSNQKRKKRSGKERMRSWRKSQKVKILWRSTWRWFSKEEQSRSRSWVAHTFGRSFFKTLLPECLAFFV